ncbi:MAG: right-handed parallel beta-helix repeat-containing protein, partial [Parcubacteria group bacterium]
MIGKIFGKRNSKTSKKIVASIMMPIFVLQMCSLNLLLASPALAEFTAVGPPVDTNCSDSSYTVAVKHHNGSIDRCFKTIQAAVDDSSTETGDNINVKKAKYEEKVTVNKGVTISGEKDADLTGQFTISSDSVTVEGMDITNSGDSFGIIATDVSHLTFKNNAIHDIGTTLDNGSAQAIGIVSSAKDVTDVHIEKNDISNIGNKSMLHNGSDGSSAKGVYLGNSGGSKTISDVTISDNDMTKIYASTASWKGSSVGYGGGAGAYGILVNHKTENLKVEDNKINILEGLWSHAIGLEADTPDAEVSGNTINNLKDHKNGADSMALRLESNPSATDITLDNNKFNGKKLSIDTSTVFVNAAWVSLKPDTSNTYPEVLNAPTYLYYGINAFSNIQDAVKGVANKGTINVADGTYVETGQIVIDKDLSIVGHSKTKTIIKPAQDTAGTIHDPSSGWFSVVSGKTFNLNKVTLDGSEKNILAGIFSKGHGIIENTNFNNIHYAKYAGIGIELYGSNMTISENSFNNIERIGVFNGNNTDSKIIGNVYTGKGEGDWLDYAFEVGRGSKADINGNTILNNKGVAYDGSTSAGILVTSCYGPSSSQATITGNKISKCTDGIAVGYDANDTSVVVAHKNKLSGNVNGVSSTKPLVDATENWWGSASGPTDKISGDGSYLDTNPAGKGSVALGAVKYAPWYTNAGMTDETSPNAITN